jgi:poly-gamma-glutamate capsule biosynthesis protein CapA/YwtB (metallophosphatase superfamily)
MNHDDDPQHRPCAFGSDARIINLETSVTRSDEYCVDKEIHYRRRPANIECLTRVRPDVCVLANNHVLDYGCAGLEETLDVLAGSGLKTVGAGRELEGAQQPVIVPLPRDRRVLVAATCAESSGVPCILERHGGSRGRRSPVRPV